MSREGTCLWCSQHTSFIGLLRAHTQSGCQTDQQHTCLRAPDLTTSLNCAGAVGPGDMSPAAMPAAPVINNSTCSGQTATLASHPHDCHTPHECHTLHVWTYASQTCQLLWESAPVAEGEGGAKAAYLLLCCACHHCARGQHGPARTCTNKDMLCQHALNEVQQEPPGQLLSLLAWC